MGKTKSTVPPEVLALAARANEAHISMLKLCREAGVHHDTFGRWRRGQRTPLLSTINKLSETLDAMIAGHKPRQRGVRSRARRM